MAESGFKPPTSKQKGSAIARSSAQWWKRKGCGDPFGEVEAGGKRRKPPFYFTSHTMPFSSGTTLPLLLAIVVLGFAPTLHALLPPCHSDADCSFNGICDLSTGVCACDPPWVGNLDGNNSLPDCGFLDFLPSPVSSCGKACAFHGGPSSLDTNWTSWGMSVLQVSPTEYHGFAAEMANGCGLGAWTKGSQVIHTQAASPAGPFVRAAGAPVVPPWSHNPQHITAPDGTHVIFTLGDGWAQNGPPQNCLNKENGALLSSSSSSSSLLHPLAMVGAEGGAALPSLTSRGLGNCSIVSHPSNCNPNPCWSCNITLHTSRDLNAAGPWVPHTTQLIGLSNFDNIGNWNPAPLVLPNGSIAVMIHTDDNQGWSGESIAVADTWEGPYRVTVGNEQVANLPKSQEDPFMWRDARGHFHVLYHKMFDPPGGGPCGIWAGGHSFSTDGTAWSPIFRAYNTTFRTTDGGILVAQRRERPKLIFNADLIPTHLYNGIITSEPGSGTYTAVAPLNVPSRRQ